MTIDEIKEKYGGEYRFITCEKCPVPHDLCVQYSIDYDNGCDGGNIAAERIKRMFETTQKLIDTDDNVNHPAHYTRGSIECLDAIAAAVGELTGMEAVYTAQIIKYVWRGNGKTARRI